MFESLDEQMKRDDNLVSSTEREDDTLRFVRAGRRDGIRRVDFRSPSDELACAKMHAAQCHVGAASPR